jgi:hypothetical protein
MQLARLHGDRSYCDRVLEQAAEVRVMAVARARRPAPRRAQRRVAEQRVEQRAQAGVVDLAREVLEEAIELVEVTVGDRQEGRGIGVVVGRARDRAQLDLQLVAEALDASRDAHEVAALEAPGEHVGVAEGARLDGAAAVAQLDREVRRARPRQQAILARAREDALDLLARAQRGDAHRAIEFGKAASSIDP